MDNFDEASYVANFPGFLCIKDNQNKVIAISALCAQLCGYEKPELAIGYTDHDMPCKAAESAEDFIKLDQVSITSGKKLQTLQIIYYDSWKVILTERVPTFNKDKEFIKLTISAMDMTNANFNRKVLLLNDLDNKAIKMKNANYIIDPNHQPLPLTNKQEICLFLLIRGKTMKEIASLMGISIKTVEDHLDSVKAKLNCFSKPQLIERAIDSGFFYYIPKVLIDSCHPLI